jgi:hypothetical protein
MLQARGLGSDEGLDIKTLYTLRKKSTIQIIAAAMSVASVLTTAVTFYWFICMTKRFRHKWVYCGEI